MMKLLSKLSKLLLRIEVLLVEVTLVDYQSTMAVAAMAVVVASNDADHLS